MRLGLVAATAIGVAGIGCTGQIEALRGEVDGLKARIADLDRTNAAQRQRLSGMDDRILLLQDQVETQRLAASRNGGSPLPVPSAAAAQPPAAGTTAATETSATIRTPSPSGLPVVRLAPGPSDTRGSDEAGDDTGDTASSGADGDDADVETPADMNDVYSTLDDDGRVVPRKGAAHGTKAPRNASVRPAPRAAKPAPDTSVDAAPLAEYKAAYEAYQEGRVDQALEAFRAFEKAWPKHPYADNAQYWVGECFYDRREWENARREFMRVVTEHPDGNKVPDAMVKVGLCDQRMAQPDEARRMYDSVMLTFPDSPAAAVAMRLLGEMP